MPSPPCPSCNSAKGYYRDVDNQTTRCLHCLSPVEVDLEGGEPTTKSSFTAAPEPEPKDKTVRAEDKAVRGPKEVSVGEKGPERVSLPKGASVQSASAPKPKKS